MFPCQVFAVRASEEVIHPRVNIRDPSARGSVNEQSSTCSRSSTAWVVLRESMVDMHSAGNNHTQREAANKRAQPKHVLMRTAEVEIADKSYTTNVSKCATGHYHRS